MSVVAPAGGWGTLSHTIAPLGLTATRILKSKSPREPVIQTAVEHLYQPSGCVEEDDAERVDRGGEAIRPRLAHVIDPVPGTRGAARVPRVHRHAIEDFQARPARAHEQSSIAVGRSARQGVARVALRG